jgi:hypothetical protein
LEQLEVVPSWVEHPDVSVAVHFAQPASQAGLHSPVAHEVPPDACSLPHTALQSPQLLISADTSFSQPFVRLLSQSANRPLQAGWHALPLHGLAVTWAAAAVLHTVPQLPQLLALVAVSTSQPLTRLVSQSS